MEVGGTMEEGGRKEEKRIDKTGNGGKDKTEEKTRCPKTKKLNFETKGKLSPPNLRPEKG